MDIIKIVNELKMSLMERIPDEPYKVILYGSFARNEENKNSDVDILIIFHSRIDWKIKDIVFEICSNLNVKYDLWVDVSLISLGDMNSIRGRQPFVQNALSEGIVL